MSDNISGKSYYIKVASCQEDTDRAGILRLQNGDDAAFDEIIARYKMPVINFVYRMIGDADEADDVAQEVFVRVYSKCHRFKPGGRHRFSTWLFQIARNQAIDVLRKRQRRPVEFRDFGKDGGHEPVSLVASADRETEHKEIGDAIARAVSKLPEKQKTALILAEYHNLPHAEIAAVMQCSVKSVESRLARARCELRRKLAWLR